MVKKEKAIYAPGELSRVREKLGVTDKDEAKRMAELLGGEVGFERDIVEDQSKSKKPVKRDQGAETSGGRRRGRRVDIAGDDENRTRNRTKSSGPYPGDDPSVPLKLGYGERVKIDQYAGQVVFEIKSSMQVFTSIFSFFKQPIDYVNPRFITKRMNEYYNKIEKLVSAVKNLFPKSNSKRNNQLKRVSPFVYKILEVIRSWNIEDLSKGIAELQAHPRAVKVSDLTDVLKLIYKPLFILDDLSIDNFKTAFKLVYKILYIESPIEAKNKYQVIIKNIIASIMDIRRTVHFGMYPLLMKLISDRFIVYERFFTERRRRFMAFLGVTENDQLNSADLSPGQIESLDVESLQKDLSTVTETEETEAETPAEGEVLQEPQEDPNDPKVIERKAREDAEKAEKKALDQGRTALETIFPQAGWEKLEECPDFYPYFANVYSMRHGYELIAPTDPLQQVSVLMNILDDLFIGLRYISFGMITGADGSAVRVSDELIETLNNWRRYIEDSFSKDYLPRLTEYCRLLENSGESRSSPYAKKILNELHWIKRLYFLPYYKFESIGPPPFTKNEVVPIYSIIRKIRKTLTSIALGIEQGVRAGGAAAKASCNGINNPWENYNFQVPNPVSRRLDILLPPEKRINATIIFFTLSAVTVLDHIINYENSWAYQDRPGPLFRSLGGDGLVPIFGVDEKLDADKIFKEVMKKQQIK